MSNGVLVLVHLWLLMQYRVATHTPAYADGQSSLCGVTADGNWVSKLCFAIGPVYSMQCLRPTRCQLLARCCNGIRLYTHVHDSICVSTLQKENSSVHASEALTGIAYLTKKIYQTRYPSMTKISASHTAVK